jgi:uncharacterized lipoprotein
MKQLTLIVASLILLAACGERSQAMGEERDYGDAPPWQGTANGYAASGWTPGDQASWQKQMQMRNQAQNEYNRTN